MLIYKFDVHIISTRYADSSSIVIVAPSVTALHKMQCSL